MNILLASNSLKECAESTEVANLFERFLDRPNFKFIKKPISDGGDGFLEVCKLNFYTKTIFYEITSDYNDQLNKIRIEYDKKNNIIFIESAEILGLKVIPKDKRNPLKINSKSLGYLLQKIKKDVEIGKYDVKEIYIGIGGTGTNDLGLGACSQFGLKLFDLNNNELEIIPENYLSTKTLIWKKLNLPFKIISIVDVNNKLLGKDGATLTFAEQKGARKKDLPVLENGFKNILEILKKQNLVVDIDNLSGAGGGLAAGFSIFFNAEIKKSKEFILNDLGIAKLKDDVDVVITGEGAFDSQSLMDKGSGVILDLFKNSNKKIFLCCGIIEENVKSKLGNNIHFIEFKKYFSSKEESIKNYKKGIELACLEIKKVLNS